MEKELKKAEERFEELERQLSDTSLSLQPEKIKEISQEYKRLQAVLLKTQEWRRIKGESKETEKLLREENDPEIKKISEEELASLETKRKELEKELKILLTPPVLWADKNIIVEIRAGTGGEEAALFAADLMRMYLRYAESKGWQTKLLSSNRTGLGGFKELIFEVKGKNTYRHLQFESGVHRVQRIPTTEKSGRVHTSTATVAILPEAEEVDINLKPQDLKIETSTARGHGGQSVNTTYSAVRVTHLPTGLVVSCQDERSQLQNRERALTILRSRLLAREREKKQVAEKTKRREQIGQAKRAEKIRTYNFPQDRLTDHRLEQNFHNLTAIMDGKLDDIIAALKEAENKEE